MNNKVLGTIAMICAPALLLEVILRGGEQNALTTGIAGMIVMAGRIRSNIGIVVL